MRRVPLTNINNVLWFWTKKFEDKFLCQPRSSAEYIIAHVLGKKTLSNVDGGTVLTKSQVNNVKRLCELRMSRMPVQYVVGEWDFHDLTLEMRQPVLIPRPESEELASLCMDTLSALPTTTERKTFLEIGPGTGAISLSILKKFSQLDCVAVDISEDACKLTQGNAERMGTAERCLVIHGDIKSTQVLEQLQKLGPFCLAVSNPPYISTSEMDSLQEEVRCFEDHQALHGGKDGMDIIREVMLKTSQLLQRGGHLWLEVGVAHSSLVKSFATDPKTWKDLPQQLQFLETVTDLYGKLRFCHLIVSSGIS